MSETAAYLAERIRTIVGEHPGITEKTMFGGLTFLIDGHILAGCRKDGSILISVGKEHNDDALARPGATAMVHNGRTMTGFIWVDGDAIEDDADLAAWISLALSAVTRHAEKPRRTASRPAKSTKAATSGVRRKPRSV